jgi:hypothetical protein
MATWVMYTGTSSVRMMPESPLGRQYLMWFSVVYTNTPWSSHAADCTAGAYSFSPHAQAEKCGKVDSELEQQISVPLHHTFTRIVSCTVQELASFLSAMMMACFDSSATCVQTGVAEPS